MKIKLIFIAGVFFLLTGYGCSEKEGGVVEHPVDEYIPHYSEYEETSFAEPDTEEIEDPELQDFLAALNNVEKLFSLGLESGNRMELFGNIKDVVTDSKNNIYILDDQAPAVRMFDSTGTFLSEFGGTMGRGPTDLVMPQALAVDGNDRVYVTFPYNEVKILEYQNSQLEYVESISTPEIVPMDICILGDEIFIRSQALNKAVEDTAIFNMVHAYSLDDHRYLRSFGKRYNSPRMRTNEILSGGQARVACNENTNTVMYTFKISGFFLGYSPEGEFKWIKKITPWRGTHINETIRGGRPVRWGYAYGGDMIRSILSFDNFFLIQVYFVSAANTGNEIKSYLLSAGNDSPDIFAGTDKVPYLKAFNNNYFYVNNGFGKYPGLDIYKPGVANGSFSMNESGDRKHP